MNQLLKFLTGFLMWPISIVVTVAFLYFMVNWPAKSVAVIFLIYFVMCGLENMQR